MFRPKIKFCILTVVAVVCTVISPGRAQASVAPDINYLGQIREGLFAPTRVDVDGAGNLYVVDARKYAVYKFDKYGSQVADYKGFALSGAGLAVTEDGSRLYVAGTTQVFVVDAKTGTMLPSLGSGAGEFGRVGEIDLDADGYVYVADTSRMRVAVYNAQGVYQYPIGGRGNLAGQFRIISSMSVDPLKQEVLVADSAIGTGYLPMLQRFGLAGNYLGQVLAGTGFGSSRVDFFGGMTRDDSGRTYVLDLSVADLRILGSAQEYLASYGTAGYGDGQLSNPADVVYDAVTGRLFVANGSGRIEIFGVDVTENPVNSNTAPTSPEPISPANEVVVASAQPVLTFFDGADEQDDALTYNVRLWEGEALLADYAAIAATGSAAGTSEVRVADVLTENGHYAWAVQAFDGELASDWTSPQGFYVNAIPEVPSAPALMSPAASAVVNGRVALQWQAAQDPDPFDQVNYLVQIAAEPTFAEPIVDQMVTATSILLGDLSGYAELVNGAPYYWRVKAVDALGLESAAAEVRVFTYQTTALKVSANMPDAAVSFGGNHAFSGRPVGFAPVELRDIAAGTLRIVVEHAGFEPWVGQAVLAEGESLEVYAALVPAVSPIDLKARPLTVGGEKILRGADAVPVVVDYDGDGLLDLLTGEASGVLTLYRGTEGEVQPSFVAGSPLDLVVPSGAVPVVVDWNNDGQMDLLVGTNAGTILYYQRAGDTFAQGAFLQAAGSTIAVGSAAVPVVFDLDADGDKDLLIGSGAGAVVAYRNSGTDAVPVLSAPVSLLPAFSGNAAPFVVDWNADGKKDLLVASNQHLYLCLQQADGSFGPRAVLAVTDDLAGNSGRVNGGAGYFGDRLHVFAYDADGLKGKDLLVGNATGEIRLVRSNGKEFVAAFAPALVAKVEQLEVAIAENAAGLAPSWGGVATQLLSLKPVLGAGDFVAAREEWNQLPAEPSGVGSIDAGFAELSNLLP